MILFLIILILILSLGLGGMYLFFNSQLLSMKQQLHLTSRSYKNLKDDMINRNKVESKITVRFNNPNSNIGFIDSKNKVKVFLAPYNYSPIINEVKEKIQVRILDEAEANNDTWYYVNLPINTNVNSKGWIRKRDFNLIMNGTGVDKR